MLMLSACVSTENKATTVNLPGGATFRLLAPDTLSRSLVATQRIKGQFKEREFVMLAQLEIDHDHLAVVGATASGNTLFSVHYTRGTIAVERSSFLPEQLQPAYMLADLQMAFWPLAALEPQLTRAGLDISERTIQGQRSRYVRKGEQSLIEIHYSTTDPWQGSVTFENKAWEYSYTIDTVQVETL
jgi:Protein of unknown function (DUF3261)